MESLAVEQMIVALLIVLAAGFLAGSVCKRLGVSLLIGYLVVGAVIGQGGLGLVSQANHELEYLARAGVWWLLFSVGIEFSPEQLRQLIRPFFLGGATQMLAVTAPLTVVCLLFGMAWQPALLAGAACALSSTVLVFKALAEWGQTATPHGRRAIGILLFQDVALVPLMLLIPFLTGAGEHPTFVVFAALLGKSLVVVAAVVLLRAAIARWTVPLLAKLRSVELVVLFTVTLLGSVCWGAQAIGLPPAVGALATGLMLSGNRLSKQIDTLVLPYRETFAAVFFVTLGTLLHPLAFFDEPLLLISGLVGILLLKSLAATLALRLTGLSWKAAAGTGIGLAQLGEFSFLLIGEGVGQGIISAADYNRILFIALGTLILTPQLIRLGLPKGAAAEKDQIEPVSRTVQPVESVQKAVVIGIGVIGRQISSRLETLGIDVCLVDMSPINLYPFAQLGFTTVAGDACDLGVLRRADAAHRRLGVVCVPDDDTASRIVLALRELNPGMSIIVRCRLVANVSVARKAGANLVVSEEQEASAALLNLCEQAVRREDAILPDAGR